MPSSSIRSERGSALLLVVLALLIAGMLSAGYLYSLKSVTRETQEEATIARMNRVVHALSAYLQKYNRIPCPADPDTASATFGIERANCLVPVSLQDGIVPFKTIGLSPNDVTDAWGHYFTYHTDSHKLFSAADAVAYITAYPNTKVHDLCRVKDVWVDRGGLLDNWYPQYALACCEYPNDSIAVVNKSGADVTGAASWSNAEYQPQHSPAPPASIHSTILPAFPVMVLISHGQNGKGSYLGTGTHARMTFTGASAGEAANATGDIGNNTFVHEPRTESSSYYFDDIVIYKTLSALYADTGSAPGAPICTFNPGCPPVPAAAATSNSHTPSPITDLNGNPCP